MIPASVIPASPISAALLSAALLPAALLSAALLPAALLPAALLPAALSRGTPGSGRWRLRRVSVPTVEMLFGTKSRLPKAAIDVAVAGDDEPVAVLDRPWTQAAEDARSLDEFLSLVAEALTAAQQRSAGLMLAVFEGSSRDAELEALRDQMAALREATAAVPHGGPRRLVTPRRREVLMKTNRSIPDASVIPVLIYPDVREAVAWLTGAFGFAERLRIGENHRSQLRFGDGGALIVADVRGDHRPPRPGEVTHSVTVRVPDARAHCERARSHGARILMEPTDFEYGERQYHAEDPFGHHWTFSETLADVAPEQWGGEIVSQ